MAGVFPVGGSHVLTLERRLVFDAMHVRGNVAPDWAAVCKIRRFVALQILQRRVGLATEPNLLAMQIAGFSPMCIDGCGSHACRWRPLGVETKGLRNGDWGRGRKALVRAFVQGPVALARTRVRRP